LSRGGTGLIYSASQDRSIKVWNSEGRLLHTLSGHAHWVNYIALSADHALRTGFHAHSSSGPLPISRADKIAKAKQRYEKAVLIADAITEQLVSASDDGVLYLWNAMGPTPTKPIAKMVGHQKPINHVAFSPDGMWIASASFDNSLKLWSGKDGKFVLTFRGHVAPVSISSTKNELGNLGIN
jgi:ribosome assembly protein 4